MHECQKKVFAGTLSPPPELVSSSWNQVRSRMTKLLEPLVTRTREKWQWFQVPRTFQGFVQTYYDDHLRDLVPRTQAWLWSSKDSLLKTAHNLCPQFLCQDRNQH
ncbi:apolipoprotein C-IV isoform X2 [Rhinolophus ferrumequinum]|uniref:apolipoprotein C-IV isoform X2 n=1 Tax=Rhinolophus ferrumequinum TaxID=59479 RepID=UPI00140FE087|nr:apolipoprotein C-IV isoform X2 [Rhinolophus ferrumequinum]